MIESFLLNFMRVAHQITKAERAFAVDSQLTVLGTIGMSPDQIEALYLKCARDAISRGEPLITDNYTMTIEPSKAPVTNQSFPQLRAVFFIPLDGHGAICLDQRLQRGIIAKDKVDRLMQLGRQVVAAPPSDLTEDALLALYSRA
jgi:hypothetical protein